MATFCSSGGPKRDERCRDRPFHSNHVAMKPGRSKRGTAAPTAAVEPCGLREVPYEETEHFTITREFLNNHRALLKVLLEDDDT